MLHTLEPKCLMEITQTIDKDKITGVLKRYFKKGFTVLRTGESFVISIVDTYDQTIWTDEVFDTLVDQAAKWYCNYLKGEDDGIDESFKASQN